MKIQLHDGSFDKANAIAITAALESLSDRLEQVRCEINDLAALRFEIGKLRRDLDAFQAGGNSQPARRKWRVRFWR